MEFANRAEQAIDGLDITAAGGVILVEDGHTRWLCPENRYDAVYAALERMPALKDDEGGGEAYTQLCNRLWLSCPIAVVDQDGHSGSQEARHDLIRQALQAELIDEATARRMGLPAVRVEVEHKGVRYAAQLEGVRVTVVANGVVAGTGRWDGGRIVDSPALLGGEVESPEVYELLDAALATEIYPGTRRDGRYSARRQPTSEYVAYGGESMHMGYWSGGEDSLPAFRRTILDELREGLGEEEAEAVEVGIYRVKHDGDEGKETEQGERIWLGNVAQAVASEANS